MKPTTITVRCAATVTEAEHATEGQAPEQSIAGTILTYGQVIHPFGPWLSVRLADGSLEVPGRLSEVKLLADHDTSAVIGSMSALTTKNGAVQATYRVARTARAQEALTLAADGHIDGLSVGFTVLDGRDVVEDGEEIFEVTRAALKETSLVAWPADTTARITDVAAEERAAQMPNETTEQQGQAVTAATVEQMIQQHLAAAAPVVSPVPETVQAGAAALPVALSEAPRVLSADGRPLAVRASDRGHRYPGVWTPQLGYVTAGDFFAAHFRASQHGEWERYATVRAALADETTAEIPGLLPRAIVGEMLGRATGRRPGWDSFTARDMPMAGKTFDRPKISQHVKVDPQTAEKTEVVSQTYKVELDAVTKTTLAGALDVSRQALDWSSPALINELLRDFVAIYIKRTDQLAMTNLVAGATGAPVTWDGSNLTIVASLAAAASKVYLADTNGIVDFFPNVLWMDPTMWARLAGLTDTTGRPLFPTLGVMNAPGTIDISDPENGFKLPGVRIVVDKHLPADTLIMGDREAVESYENGRQFLQAVRADVLGLDIAYMGYVATYIPWPKALVKITVTPPPEGAAATTSTTSK